MAMRKMPPKTCTHYWVIEEAKGATSKGICKICGEAKEFSNSIPFVSDEWLANKYAAEKEKRYALG